MGGLAGLAITTPFQAALLTVLYFDLRVRKEGFDLELLAREIGSDAPAALPIGPTPTEPAPAPAHPTSVPPPTSDPGGQHWLAPPGWRAPASGGDADRGGNLDAPQFDWLRRELRDADRRDELVIVFGHHPISSLTNDAPDENAGDCALRAITGPGCDLDPRGSRPLRLGGDLRRLLLQHPRVLAYVAGHTHENRATAHRREGDARGGFWSIETASEIDWPIQSRLLEVMDNRDGTLSIFGTLLDHAATLVTPRSGASAARLGPEMLAALGREFAFNDPQVGVEAGAEGRPQDRNVLPGVQEH